MFALDSPFAAHLKMGDEHVSLVSAFLAGEMYFALFSLAAVLADSVAKGTGACCHLPRRPKSGGFACPHVPLAVFVSLDIAPASADSNVVALARLETVRSKVAHSE
jgi:hypothetical protein